MKNIPNPYAVFNIPEEQLVRIQADVSRQDRNLIRAICPEQGVYGFTVAHLIIKLCHELRKRNITDCSREADFREAIVKCRIIFDEGDNNTANGGLPDQSASGSVPETAGRDDRVGATAVRSGNASDEDKSSNVQVPHGGGKAAKGHKGAGRVRTAGKDE